MPLGSRWVASHVAVSMPCPGVRSTGPITRWNPGSVSASPGVSAHPGCMAVKATSPRNRRAHSRMSATCARLARA